MAARIKGRSKPQGVTLAIDRNADVNRGLLYALPYDQAVYHDRAYGITADPSVPANLTEAAGVIGKCVVSSAAGDGRQGILAPTRFPADDCDWTMRWVFELTSVSGNQCLIRATAGININCIYIFNGQLAIYNSGSGSNPVTLGPTLSVNTLYDVHVTHLQGATNCEFFINGVSIGTQTPTPAAATFSLTNAFNVWGDTFTSFTQWLQGKRYLYQAWSRQLGYGEIAENYRHFWRSFTRPGRAAVGAAPGGATAIALAQAGVSWIGTPANENAKTDLALSQKAASWTGAALGVNAKTMIAATQRAWLWGGQAIGSDAKTFLTLTQGAMQWVGTALSSGTPTNLALVQQGWSWTGSALAVNAKTALALASVTWNWVGRAFTGFGALVVSIGLVRGAARGLVGNLVRGAAEREGQ